MNDMFMFLYLRKWLTVNSAACLCLTLWRTSYLKTRQGRKSPVCLRGPVFLHSVKPQSHSQMENLSYITAGFHKNLHYCSRGALDIIFQAKRDKVFLPALTVNRTLRLFVTTCSLAVRWWIKENCEAWDVKEDSSLWKMTCVGLCRNVYAAFYVTCICVCFFF